MGYIWALLAVSLFGANGSLIKVIIDAGISPAQVSFFRTLGTAIIAGIILAIIDRKSFRLSKKQLQTMALLGILGVAPIQYFYSVALSLIPVGMTLLIEYLAVPVVALISMLFFHEKLKKTMWVAVLLVIVGVALIAGISGVTFDPIGIGAAVLASASMVIYLILGERQVKGTSPLAVAFWPMVFASVLWIVVSQWWTIDSELYTASSSLGGNLETISLPLWLILLVTVIFGSFLPFFFSFTAMKTLSATVIGIIGTSEVVFGFAFAWLWLNEALTPIQILGALIVITGIVVAQRSRQVPLETSQIPVAPS
ncbi:MAG: DMT family transporter [Microbacteriaceae bacterium]|nr:DMT family transporter [Microbacteriaceae bacterium]